MGLITNRSALTRRMTRRDNACWQTSDPGSSSDAKRAAEERVVLVSLVLRHTHACMVRCVYKYMNTQLDPCAQKGVPLGCGGRYNAEKGSVRRLGVVLAVVYESARCLGRASGSGSRVSLCSARATQQPGTVNNSNKLKHSSHPHLTISLPLFSCDSRLCFSD